MYCRASSRLSEADSRGDGDRTLATAAAGDMRDVAGMAGGSSNSALGANGEPRGDNGEMVGGATGATSTASV